MACALRRSFMVLMFSILVAGCNLPRATAAVLPTPTAPVTAQPAAASPLPSPTTTPTAAVTATYWPTHAWRVSTPEDQGMNSSALATIVDNIAKQNMHIHSLLVIRHGYIVSEVYFYPSEPGVKHEQFSITKGITSALAGIAIGQGRMRLEDRALSFFPDLSIANRDKRKEAITVQDLLRMTAGLSWSESSAPYGNPANMETQMSHSQNWLQFVLDRPMADDPGSKFVYNSGAVHVLSAIIQRVTQMTTLTFARKYLFGPLGISDVKWLSDPQGITEGPLDLWLAPRDMAKIGYLYLQNGVWDGQQVLPPGWVEASTSKQSGGDPGFGYQWRRTSFGAYEAVGWGSQLIGVQPDQDLVVVVTGGVAPHEPGSEEGLFKLISQRAVKSSYPLPPNPTAETRLDALGAMASRPPSNRLVALAPAAARIAHQTYVLAGEPDGIRSFSLTFGGQEAVFDLRLNTGERRLNVGLDGAYRFTNIGSERWAARGRWNEQTFVIETLILGAADSTTYTLTFTDTRVYGKAAAHIEDHTVELHGQTGDAWY